MSITPNSHQIEYLNQGQVLYITLTPNSQWARSEFPSPLVTIDYNHGGAVIGISSAGPAIPDTLEHYRSWLTQKRKNIKELVAKL